MAGFFYGPRTTLFSCSINKRATYIMAKRFYDSMKFDDPWYRKLTPKHKCFWEYLLCKCTHSGIWKPDFEMAEGDEPVRRRTMMEFVEQIVDTLRGTSRSRLPRACWSRQLRACWWAKRGPHWASLMLQEPG